MLDYDRCGTRVGTALSGPPIGPSVCLCDLARTRGRNSPLGPTTERGPPGRSTHRLISGSTRAAESRPGTTGSGIAGKASSTPPDLLLSPVQFSQLIHAAGMPAVLSRQTPDAASATCTAPSATAAACDGSSACPRRHTHGSGERVGTALDEAHVMADRARWRVTVAATFRKRSARERGGGGHPSGEAVPAVAGTASVSRAG